MTGINGFIKTFCVDPGTETSPGNGSLQALRCVQAQKMPSPEIPLIGPCNTHSLMYMYATAKRVTLYTHNADRET